MHDRGRSCPYNVAARRLGALGGVASCERAMLEGPLWHGEWLT
jgi:hypothetical protein